MPKNTRKRNRILKARVRRFVRHNEVLFGFVRIMAARLGWS
jgi:hypothetical protein